MLCVLCQSVSNQKHPQNTPGVKKGSQELKQALLWIGLKVLVMTTSLQNIVISGAQGLPADIDGIKILAKMTRPLNMVFYLNV